MTTTKTRTRALSLLLAILVVIGLLPMAANAASIEDGSKTATIAPVERHHYLKTTAGTSLGASAYQYTTNDGLSGAAFCIDHGLNYASKALPITGKYSTSPKTAGAFANGYPQHSVETFLGLYLSRNPILEGITEAEFGYATQLAIWATLGQLAIEGTPFTNGRETVAQPTGDTQQMRVFRATQLILQAANGWDRVYQTGMYIRTEDDALGANISIPADMTLEYAADSEQYGIRREVINGKTYFTIEYIFASATSTYYSGYNIELWADNAPAGTIFTDLSNNELDHSTFREQSTWKLPVEYKKTDINGNGFEYSGKAKLCIPADTVPNSGEITVRCGAYIMQYQIYLAKNDIYYEQSYIIADPSKGTMESNAVLNWGGVMTETGSLQVTKTNSSGVTLEGAKFTLTGTDGSSRTGTTDANGIILWEQLDPTVTYTLTETEAPAGYSIVDPINVQVKAARTNFVTVQDSAQKQLSVRKIDKQTGYSLGGCVIAFEQIDGTFRTTRTTDQAGLIQMDADQLPIGSYKVYEVTAPEGYELDDTVQTVNWDGKRDVTLTFNNVRKPTLIIYKCDAGNTRSLNGATFEVYKNGTLFTTVSTNDNGLAYVPGVTTGYYTVKEIIAPAGYVLDTSEHSVYVDNYNPATTDDPRIVIENAAQPMLRIVKYDAQTMKPLPDTTFEVYRDTVLIGQYTTDANGEIFLYDLEPGTYLVKEIAVAPGYVVNSTPQQVELEAGSANCTLVFLNLLKPGIRLVKLDAETMKPLANAKFRIYQPEFRSAGANEYVTDSNGEIDLSGLNPGAYVVEEIEAPDGYLIDDAQRIITINPGETAQFVFTDTSKPSITVVKYDANLDKMLPGATFRVSRIEDGSHYLDRITDTDGTFTIENLEPGVYSVVELDAPAGYVKNEVEYHVELFAGRNSRLVVNNEAKPDLKIIKKDADTGALLPGAVFTINKADGSTLTTERTNANGEILLEDLDPGVYQITETTPPEGYLPAEKPTQLITLVPNKLGTAVFENHVKPTLTVNKVDSITGDPIKGARFQVFYASSNTFTGEINDLGFFYSDDNGKFTITDLREGWYRVKELSPAAGYAIKDSDTQDFFVAAGKSHTVTFENTPLSAIVIKKVDSENGEPLQGAWFRVRYLGGTSGTGGTVIGEYQTSSNGTIVITNLRAGTYVVEEISAPKGYVLSEDDVQTVYLSSKEQDVITVTFGNEANGALLIKKVDAVTHEPISDVKFFVTTSDGAVVGNANGYFTTDSAGTILIEDLKPGITIVVKEVEAKDGYVLDDTPQTIKIRSKETVTLEFRNAPKGSLVILKKDASTHEPLAGVRFLVTTTDGAVVGNNNGYYTTDASGSITISGLNPGTNVVVKEAQTIDGYVLDDTPQTAVIKSNETVTLEFLNAPKGSLIIVKRDSATGEPLKGVEFEVKTSDGRYVANNGGKVSSNGRYYTDENGMIVITKLTPGTYVVTETKTIAGYVLDETPRTVVVNADDVQTLIFTNPAKGSLIILKKDSVTGKPLEGVAFKVTTSAGTFVADKGGTISSNGIYKTDKNGQITISSLAPDTYVVTELETIPGYTIDEHTRTQTVVVNTNDTQTLTFYNVPAGGLQIIKSDEDTGERIKGVKFEVRKINGEIIGTFTTDANGVIALPDAQSGWYTITELKAAKGYELDATPTNACVKDGQTTTVEITNKRMCSLMIHKIDADTHEGIYGVTFILYDSGKNPIGEYITDQYGYVYIADELEAGRYYLRELEAADGYTLDTQYKTIYIERGKCTQIEWENKAITGQIQIRKYSSAYNTITGTPAGSALQGAVYEISQVRSGRVVGYIVTDARGVAASNPLPLGRYYVTEVTAPKYYQLSGNKMEAEIEYPGQIIKLSDYDKPVELGVTIKKIGNKEAQPGSYMRYDFSNIANTSNVALNNFYWHDRIPTDAVTAVSLTTGTYNQRLYYRIMFKTNLNDYRVLATNLLTSNNYSIKLTASALGLAQGEYVTDFRYEFGTVASGFASSVKPTLQVQVNGNVSNNYKIINRADVGGQYLNEWQTANTVWVTTVYRFENPTPLPKTGY